MLFLHHQTMNFLYNIEYFKFRMTKINFPEKKTNHT